jgi:hypothetical protein
MNGFIKATVAGLCLGTGFTTMVGCSQYRQLVDPCWPERYNAEARASVRETFGAQAHNGHVMDQTMWNYYFEVDPQTGAPTDKLNAGGIEHLKHLARRQPAPDPTVYLQTAQKVPDGATLPPDKFAQARSELDGKRIAAIQKYLAGMMTGRSQAVAFEVAVHDPAEVGIAATPIAGNQYPVIKGAVPVLYENYKGKMPGIEGVTITTTGGGS